MSTTCDRCGDVSNSAPGLPCGRVDPPDPTPCTGTYRAGPVEAYLAHLDTLTEGHSAAEPGKHEAYAAATNLPQALSILLAEWGATERYYATHGTEDDNTISDYDQIENDALCEAYQEIMGQLSAVVDMFRPPPPRVEDPPRT